MVKYNFKSIQVVPNGQEFIDIVLTRTQRKTPTVVHPGYSINRIRTFYMRKVKFTQTTINEKLSQILSDFPILDEIHPFYADLLNVLYDRDHYKLALGQLNMARRLVDNIAKDYLRLLKFGDSLYRCKQLKRAALGRMVKVLKKNKTAFAYLEEVRQHMSRLPSIDPDNRTLLVTGYPNVGKSSFMNKITRANVEVQPFAFTTKSLFVGHTDYRYLTWQVIDTPGILDHPLEERNTKEMQSITALAHLKASILYFIDISELCGYSIEQQVNLFESIKPLFTGKPILIILNKIDARPLEDLTEKEKHLIESISQETNINVVPMSNFNDLGIAEVKEKACDLLLEMRTEMKINSKKSQNILNRLHIAVPEQRDDEVRVPVEKPVESAQEKAQRKNEQWRYQMELYKTLDPDYIGMDWREEYQLEDEEWKYDKIPQIMDGKNIFDFWSSDIEERLEELEREELQRLRDLEEELQRYDLSQYKLTPAQREKVQRIREKKRLMILESQKKKAVDGANLPRNMNPKKLTIGDFEEHLAELGMDGSRAADRMRSSSRDRSESRGRALERVKERSQSRAKSYVPKAGEGFLDAKQKLLGEFLARKSITKLSKDGRKGESDRHVFDLKPKHLFSGKRGIGSNDRR
eukprot:TRINITY_DN9083_c0_g1_i1.p1 TRINITY_DN9083_c0_g1~~TRINITY_DN9083_c0_g1_i1.p1  ORF type:complete len:636 (-),score=186.64 TRINITY_DN9083_c0_g1_i1:88-1995(-)